MRMNDMSMAVKILPKVTTKLTTKLTTGIRRCMLGWANPQTSRGTSRMALVSLLVWGMTSNLCVTLYASTPNDLGTDARPADWVASGRDERGDPWLRSRAGITGHFRALSSQEVRIELSMPAVAANGTSDNGQIGQPLGWVEMGSVAGEDGLFVKWSPDAGQDLTIRSTRQRVGGQRVEIGYNSEKAVFFLDTRGGAGRSPEHDALQGAEKLLGAATAQPALRQLVKEAAPFLTREALSLLPAPPVAMVGGGISDCASHITDCLVILVAYGAGMGSLLGSCGFTFGWGCAGALVAHPILAGASAIYCGRAGHTCSQ